MGTLTHLRVSYKELAPVPHMVDVSGKAVTARTAEAEARVSVARGAWEHINLSQRDTDALFSTATVAGVMAAKQTSSLIPMCHPLPLDKCNVEVRVADLMSLHHVPLVFLCWARLQISRVEDDGTHKDVIVLRVRCVASTSARTGVEMEAMTGASIAALTLYDMLKSGSKGIIIEVGNQIVSLLLYEPLPSIPVC
jgi:cyclic pyranopterin monophosphate synthase